MKIIIISFLLTNLNKCRRKSIVNTQFESLIKYQPHLLNFIKLAALKHIFCHLHLVDFSVIFLLITFNR